MNIQLKWDQSQLDTFAGQLPRRLAFASVNAVNDTAKRIQQAEFARARAAFVIRKQAFFFGAGARVGGVAARITQFASATKGIAYAEITAGEIGGSGGWPSLNRSRLLYSRFEEGGTREPFTTGAKSVAAPITGRPARPSIAGPIVPQFTFAGMKLQAYYRNKKLTRQTMSRKNLGVGLLGMYGRLSIPRGADGIQWKGRERTFIAFTSKHPRGAVFQRFGRGKNDIRIIWVFLAPFKIDTRLHFVATAQAVAAQYFREECQKQVDLALEHDNLKLLGLT